jgi:hypothetical protein
MAMSAVEWLIKYFEELEKQRGKIEFFILYMEQLNINSCIYITACPIVFSSSVIFTY